MNTNKFLFFSFSCSQKEELEDDVYNFGFILFESLAGPIASEKGEAFFLDEKVKAFENVCLIFPFGEWLHIRPLVDM